LVQLAKEYFGIRESLPKSSKIDASSADSAVSANWHEAKKFNKNGNAANHAAFPFLI
jgi:hypothetical protein